MMPYPLNASSNASSPRDLELPVSAGDFPAAAEELQQIGREFQARGWSLATSSNYSVVLTQTPLRLLITGSGFDKGKLLPAHFVVVDERGRAVETSNVRPSAETLLHVAIVAERGAGAVLHTHSVWGTLVSGLHEREGGLVLEGYEMLKALRGVASHEHRHWLKIFPNTQDIAALARELIDGLRAGDPGLSHGFLMAGHGLYTWGVDLDEARRHVEAFEFLFEVVGRRHSLR